MGPAEICRKAPVQKQPFLIESFRHKYIRPNHTDSTHTRDIRFSADRLNKKAPSG